jgi:Putative Flp pilus-assembly TadE/G-like
VVRLDRTEDAGAIAILVAVLSLVLFGFAAIVVDLGYARTVRSDAQSTVDAASLAGASILSKDSSPSAPFVVAIKAIKKLASENFGTTDADWAACSATPPTPTWKQGGSDTDCILFNHSADNPSKVQVVLPAKHVDSFFGGLVGYGGTDISVRAQATIHEDDVPGCAVCVQGLLDTSGDIAVYGGSTGGSVSAGSGRVRSGSISVQAPGAITFAATPIPPSGPSYSSRPIVPRPVTDPFLGDPMPRGPASNPSGAFPSRAPGGSGNCGDDGVLTEHTYRNITVTASVDHPCVATGVIVVTGRLEVRSGGYLSAASAAIQLSCGRRTAAVCTRPRAGGQLQIDDDGRLTMSASLAEFSVVADPNNTSPMTIRGELSVDQAIYGRSTPVELQDPGASIAAAGRISVSQMTVDPVTTVTVTAAGGESLPGPPFVGLFR